MRGGGDERALEGQPVAGIEALRLRGNAGPVEGGEEEVAAPVAGEHPAGAVRAVGGRREAEDQAVGVVIAEVRHGAAPIGLVAEGGALLAGDALAPLDEPGAQAAVHEVEVEVGDRVHGLEA